MAAIASQLAYVSSEWQRDEALEQHIDLYLKPPIQGFGLLEFDKLQQINALGYEEAVAKLRAWKSELRARNDPCCAIFDLAKASGSRRAKKKASPTSLDDLPQAHTYGLGAPRRHWRFVSGKIRERGERLRERSRQLWALVDLAP